LWWLFLIGHILTDIERVKLNYSKDLIAMRGLQRRGGCFRLIFAYSAAAFGCWAGQ
jgi:hypothetical protein